MRIIGNINRDKQLKRETLKPKKVKEGGKVLVFGDVHAPFTKQEYLEFLKEQKKIHKPDLIICDGDFFDVHSVSNWDVHPDAVGTLDEVELSKEWVKKYAEVFPDMILILGNHDRRIQRKGAKAGLSDLFIRTLYEIYDIPNTWIIMEEYIYNDVLYMHGSSTGKDAALDNAKIRMMSTVSGHVHSGQGIKYFSNGHKTIFGMNPGCLVDADTYAMAYNQNAQKKELFGCGIVYNSRNAIVIPYIERSE